MGNPVKRRDSVPIVKDIFGGSTEIIMLQKNILMAIDYIKNILQNIVDEKYPIDKFILTKSLRSGYKNPNSIAHKILADRIAARDPGNKPCSGDRIPFVYYVTQNKKALQGERIETPTFVKENNLKIDYSFYITNQIMKPILQIFALGLESIWKSQNKYSKLQKYKKEENAINIKFKDDPKKAMKAIEKLRCNEVKQIIFDDYLRKTTNASQGNQSVKKFFTIC
jgi:DNA polymerase elongation subunit (family B)